MSRDLDGICISRDLDVKWMSRDLGKVGIWVAIG